MSKIIRNSQQSSKLCLQIEFILSDPLLDNSILMMWYREKHQIFTLEELEAGLVFWITSWYVDKSFHMKHCFSFWSLASQPLLLYVCSGVGSRYNSTEYWEVITLNYRQYLVSLPCWAPSFHNLAFELVATCLSLAELIFAVMYFLHVNRKNLLVSVPRVLMRQKGRQVSRTSESEEDSTSTAKSRKTSARLKTDSK